MPITSASEAAQRLDEYLQRAVANCEDTPQINLRHSSNPGASLFSHISRAANRALDSRKDSASIRPSEIRKAGGKVTMAGGLIKLDSDVRPSSPKRAKLDEAVLTKIRGLERGKVKHVANNASKTETQPKHDKNSSVHVDGLSRDSSASKSSVANLIKLEHVRQASRNSAGDTIVLSGKTENDAERFNIYIRAREPGKAAENSQKSDSDDKQSEKSMSSLKSGLISLKSLAELEKRLSPKNMSFRVSEKVQTNLSQTHSEVRPRPLIPASQLHSRDDQIATKVDQRLVRPKRQERSSVLVPASQMDSRAHHHSSEARPVSQNQSNQASRLATRVGNLSTEIGQVPQGHSVRSSLVSVALSQRRQETDPEAEIETELYHHTGSELDEDFSSSHLPYENIFNPNSPHSRPNIGLSEMFDDSGFDSLSNFINNDNASTGSSLPASINGLGSPMRNRNQGRILSGHGSKSAFSLVKDSSNSTQTLESPSARTGGSIFTSRIGNLHKPSPALTRLRQSAPHTVTSSSAINKLEKTATISKPSDIESDSEKPEKDFIKGVKPVVKTITQKKVQLPKPGELRRAGPYLLGKI